MSKFAALTTKKQKQYWILSSPTLYHDSHPLSSSSHTEIQKMRKLDAVKLDFGYNEFVCYFFLNK